MKKALIIGLGFISNNQILNASGYKYNFCVATGPAINIAEGLNISKKIMFINEARLAGKEFWETISQRRNEKQVYNLKVNDSINYSVPDEIWVYHHKKVFSSKEFILKMIRKKGFKGVIKIYTVRNLIVDMILVMGIQSLFFDNKLISIIDIFASILFNRKTMKFGFKTPSLGIMAILASLRRINKVDFLGISLNREFGYVNNKKISYPKLGQTAHILFDKKVLENLSTRISKL